MTLPTSFTRSINLLLPPEEAQALFLSLQQPPPVSIRLNPAKPHPQLFTLPSPLKRVPWCSTGYYLPERPSFTFDPLFHAGCYYVQEPSSMFLEQAVKQYVKSPVLALDLCAAPGGKSTHLRSLLPSQSLLVANEVIRPRSYILAENLSKWGHPDVMVTQNDPADFPAAGVAFDLILADVPCSGEGMFRKDSGAIGEWSPENVEICWQRQRRIVSDIWPCLKPGAILIYSTCTYNTRENEENVRWIIRELGAEILPLSIDGEWGITGDLSGSCLPVYRFFPHKADGEGFFLAVLRKTDEDAVSFTPVKSKKDKHQQAPRIYPDEQAALLKQLRVFQSGIPLGTMKGKDIVPAHQLALSIELDPDTFPIAELSLEEAIAYLRKEVLRLGSEVAKGYVIVAYQGVPLGFVKNIGSRANNLYPQEWRIRR